MMIEDISHLDQLGAQINEKNNRFMLPLKNGGCIIGYYPAKGIQIFIYDIRGEMPDLFELGLRRTNAKSFIRTISCRSGECELVKNGKNFLVRVGEVCVDFGREYKRLDLSAKNFRGVETVLETGGSYAGTPIYRSMASRMETVKIAEYQKKGTLQLFEMSSQTKRTMDDLARYCGNESDCAIVLIKGCELGYEYINDFSVSNRASRYFVTPSQLQIAEDVYRSLSEEFGKKWTASIFAEKYQLSATSVKKYFKCVYGYDFKEYQIKVRMDEAKRLLSETTLGISDIAERVGYATHSKFSDTFKKAYGMTPLEFRRQSLVQKITDDSKETAESES